MSWLPWLQSLLTFRKDTGSDLVVPRLDAAGRIQVSITDSPHDLGGAEHVADTLANLNAKITDANLDDSGDPRDPNAHASSHQDGGGDEVATATPAANAIPKADGSSKLDAWVTHPEIFHAYDGSGGQTLSDLPPQDMEFDTLGFNSNTAVFSWANDDELTFDVDGKVEVEARVTIEQTAGGGRTIAGLALAYRPSGGSYAFVPGSRSHPYLRNSSDGNLQTLSTSVMAEVSAGDTVKAVVWRESGSGTLQALVSSSSLSAQWSPA